MGYACPVCDVPQQDGEHLANHLAFTAMTYGDDHESWLDEHVPEWESSGPSELGPRVAELADEAEYDRVFEDTVHDHASHRGGSLFEGGPDEPQEALAAGGASVDPVDADTQAVLEEAQRLTQEMLDGDESGGADGSDGGTDGDDRRDTDANGNGESDGDGGNASSDGSAGHD